MMMVLKADRFFLFETGGLEGGTEGLEGGLQGRLEGERHLLLQRPLYFL
jgi:hypothetical protein